MAAIVNDRDNILLGTTPRLIATTVVISGNGSSFLRPKNAGAITPSSITLTANTTVFTSPSFSWEYSLSTSPGSWVSLGSGSSQNIVGTVFETLVGTTVTHVNYRVTATQSGYLSSVSPTFTISYSKQADDSVIVNISRTTASVITDAAGAFTPPAANTGTVITVTRGGTLMNYGASGADTFSVSSTVTSGTITLGSVTAAGTSVTYADITAMTTDTATVVFTVSVRDSSGSTTTYTVTETFTKIKATEAGYNHYLAPPSCFLDIDNSGNVTSYADAYTDYKVYQGVTDDTANWTFSKVDRNVASTLTSVAHDQIDTFGVAGTTTFDTYVTTGAASTLTINSTEFYTDGHLYYAAGLYIYVPYPVTGSAAITTIYTSPDGSAWTARTVPSGNYWRASYHPSIGYFVFGRATTGGGLPLILKSSTGVTWTDTTLTNLTYYLTSFNLGSYIYMVPWDGALTNNISRYNGSAWSTVTTSGLTNPSPRYRYRAVTNGSIHLIAHNTNIVPYWSTDGAAWTACTGFVGSVNGEGGGDLIYANNKFYWRSGGRYWVSADGKFFEAANAGIIANVSHFGFSNGVFHTLQSSTDNLYITKDLNVDQISQYMPNGLGDGNRPFICEYYNGIRPANTYMLFYHTFSSGGTQNNVTRILRNFNPVSGNIGYVDITATKGALTNTLTFIVQKASSTNDVLTTNIIPASTAFPANADGTVTSYTGSTGITASIRKNGVDETSLWSATTSVTSGITLTGSWPTYNVTAVSGTVDTGTVTITATKGNLIQVFKWTYTKDKDNRGGGVVINSFNPITSINGYVSLTFKSTGRVEIRLVSGETPRFLLNWIEPVSLAGGTYYVKATTTGDALTSGTTGSYLQLNADRTWVLDNTGGASPSSKHTDFKLYLSNNGADSGAAGYATTYLQADKL